MTLAEIGLRHNVSRETVRKRLVSNGVSIRSKSEASRKHAVKEHWFACIDSHEKAYILGLLMADGSISASSDCIALQLHERDDELLRAFRRAVGTGAPIFYQKRTSSGRRPYTMAMVRVHSRRMRQDLEKLGCRPRKTWNAEAPCIPEHLQKSLVCGWFDGDGSIGLFENQYGFVSGASWEIASTRAAMEGLRLLIVRGTGVKPIVEERSGGLWRLRVGGRKDIISVSSWMYANTPCRLSRKWARFAKLRRDEGARKPQYRSECDCGSPARYVGLCTRCYQRHLKPVRNVTRGASCCYSPAGYLD